jgi:hypothetical protein
LKSQAENISRQLRGWADSLQESPITGQRYLTEKSRRIAHARQDRESFLKELALIRASGAKATSSSLSTTDPLPTES